jgi:repressor LexA
MPRPRRSGLSELQRRVLSFVSESLQERGFPPSLSEIAKACGLPQKSSAAYHLRVLETRGLLKREGALARGLELMQDPFRLPVLGRVGAGGGMLAQEDVEAKVTVDKALSRGADFLLRVKGESMTGVGILEGDLVQVRKQPSAEDGDFVVALVQEEGVVKRLKKRGASWTLESAHPNYAPITEEFQILGKVVGLIRSYENR